MKRLWKSNSFGPILKDAAHGSTPDICLWVYNNLSSIDELESTFSSLLHSKERHDTTEGGDARVTVAQEGADSFTYQSQHETSTSTTLSMQSQYRRNEKTHRSIWRPPRAGELRLDVDACVDEGSGRFGIGGIVRDCCGSPLLAFGRELLVESSSGSVLECKLRAIKEGLEVCHDAGFFPTVVCSDSVLAVRAVTAEGGRRLRSRVDALSAEIKRLLKMVDGTHLEFALGSSNSVAHLIAKFVSLSHIHCVWVAGEFPCWLQELVNGDILSLPD